MESLVGHECVTCGKSFSKLSNLYRHARLIHGAGAGPLGPKSVRCALCNEDFVSRKFIELHFTEFHAIDINREVIEFDLFDDFLKWKESIEKNDICYYNHSSCTKTVKGKVTYFSCNRSGKFQSKSCGKRSVKMLGSNKINAFCPSMLKVVEDENVGKVRVEFTKTHVGHTNDIGRIRLTKKEKESIAIKLSQNIPIESILDEIRDSLTGDLERIHLLNRRDVLNIKKEFGINMDGIMDPNDQVSVRKWVESFNCENSPVILFKDQGVIDQDLFPGMKKEDFILVLMNSSQQEMLKLYGNDVICLDFTHGVNAYNFDLLTVLVLDDKREGFPAAFIISNRQDSVALSVAFKALKEQVQVSPKILMTDDSESLINAWKNVMPYQYTE